jgi:hypothetical protein
MLKVKDTVRPKALVIVAAAVNAAIEMGLFKTLHGDLFITSAQDSTHMSGSAHYVGLAVDFRTKNFPSDDAKEEFKMRMAQRLGARYDLVLEDLGGPNEHLHVELDPKRATPDEILRVHARAEEAPVS